MSFDENFVAWEIARLQRLRRVVTDTSALITLEHLGLWATAKASLLMLAIPEVMTEWRRGSPNAPDLSLLEPLGSSDYAGLITDRKLLAQAREHKLTIFSEDRRILVEAEELGIGSLCSLFLLIRLVLEGRIDELKLQTARQTLELDYRYDQRRLGLFDQMMVNLEKRGPN